MHFGFLLAEEHSQQHDQAQLRAAVEQLNRATASFAARRMDRGVRRALAGRAVDTLA